MSLTTLCYIEQDEKYLMLHRVKKKKDVNKDKWIGVGGHFEAGESPEECLLREVREETGLTLTSYRFRGIVTFLCDDYETDYMCLYTADGFEGTLTTCAEGNLEWVAKDQINSLNLWEGDKIFFQLLIENVPFFSLKLKYEQDRLVEAALNGKALELFDIRDEQGNVTGQTRERSLVHLYGTRHATAHVWIVRKKENQAFDVLLQKRSANKDSFPGYFGTSSAGHLPAGSDYLESALRELEEELGIQAEPADLRFVSMHEGYWEDEFYGKPFRNRDISAIYIYEKPVKEAALKLQKEELESVVWMDYDDCLSQMRAGTLKHCMYLDEMEHLRDWVFA